MEHLNPLDMRNHGKLYVFAVCLVMAAVVCGCAERRLIKRNVAAGRELALMFKTRENTASEPEFPRTLFALKEELSSMGLNQPLPRCECRDGALRDFLYIPGFTAMDDQRSVFLVSPMEMGLSRRILVRIDAEALVLPNSEADEVVTKSRETVSRRPGEERKE